LNTGYKKQVLYICKILDSNIQETFMPKLVLEQNSAKSHATTIPRTDCKFL